MPRELGVGMESFYPISYTHTHTHTHTHKCVCVLSLVSLCYPRTVVLQAPLYMEFSRQEYWSSLLFLTPGDLLDPGIEPTSLASPALADRFFF